MTGIIVGVGYQAELRLAKPPVAVFEALSTADGLEGWWSPDRRQPGVSFISRTDGQGR